jgi:hypothetical protein
MYIGKVCVPFDPLKVESFDVNRSVPTLNMVIGDISKGNSSSSGSGIIPCLEGPLNVFKKFIDKIKAEQLQNAKAVIASAKGNGKCCIES